MNFIFPKIDLCLETKGLRHIKIITILKDFFSLFLTSYYAVFSADATVALKEI